MLECSYKVTALALRIPPATGNAPFTWHVHSPGKLLQQICLDCPGFAHLMKVTAMQHPPSADRPWRICLYQDDLTPGNVLRPDNRRKSTAFYFSFMEFGSQLRNEAAWLTVALLRNESTKRFPGGLSEATATLLLQFFSGSVNFHEGVRVQLPACGGPAAAAAAATAVTIHARLGNMVADEKAHKEAWSVKGSSGLKPCLCCKNILMKRTDLDIADDGYWHTICEADARKFDLVSSADLWLLTDTLRAQEPLISKARHEDLQIVYGITWAPTGILANLWLRSFVRPIEVHTWDSMHIYLQGVAGQEIAYLLAALRSSGGIGFEACQRLARADWKRPRFAVKSTTSLRSFFSPAREQAMARADAFKGMASEVLNILPLLRHVVELVAPSLPSLEDEVASFRLLFDIVSLIQKTFRCAYFYCLYMTLEAWSFICLLFVISRTQCSF